MKAFEYVISDVIVSTSQM